MRQMSGIHFRYWRPRLRMSRYMEPSDRPVIFNVLGYQRRWW